MCKTEQFFLPNSKFILKRKMVKKILCSHLFPNIAWGQVLPVSVQGLAKDVVREEKLQLTAGRKTLQGEWGFTIKDFKPKPLW